MYRKELLRKITFFEGLSDAELDRLSAATEAIVCQKGDAVYSEDKGGSSLFIIVRGMVRITKVVTFDEKQTLVRLRPGEFFGEMSFIDGHQHSATAEAVEETELVVLNRANFDRLAESNPDLAYKVMMRIALQLSMLLRKMDERFVEMVNYMWGKGKV
jgi:CRP-like cAMP-binding protein